MATCTRDLGFWAGHWLEENRRRSSWRWRENLCSGWSHYLVVDAGTIELTLTFFWQLWHGKTPPILCPHSVLIYPGIVGRVSHPDAPEQKLAGTVGISNLHLTNKLTFAVKQPVYAPSAIAARGGKFRFLPGTPGYVTVSKIGSLYLGPPLIYCISANRRRRSMDHHKAIQTSCDQRQRSRIWRCRMWVASWILTWKSWANV